MTSLRTKIIKLAHEHPEFRGDLLPILKTAAAMSEDQFWDLIEPYGWGTKTTDYKAIQKDLMKKITPEQTEALSTTYGLLRNRLSAAMKKAFKGDDWVGGDSYDDLLAHIVGMGRKEYNAVLKKPELGVKRYQEGKYRESFSYALPHKSDFESQKIDKYIEWANKILKAFTLVSKIQPTDLPQRVAVKIKVPAQVVITAMKAFIKTQDVKALLAQEADIKDAAEAVANAIGSMCSFEDDATSEAIQWVSNRWGTTNMLSDLNQYMT